MKPIIVTVTDRNHRFAFDVEIPVDQPGSKVAEDVMEVLNYGNPELRLSPYYHCLYLNRQKRPLQDRETLAQAGVWNGDYITIVSRA